MNAMIVDDAVTSDRPGESDVSNPPTPPHASAVTAFGPFRLHMHPQRLCRGDTEVRLGGRAFDLLAALVERPGEVLSRSQLEARVWPYTVVEDSSLRVHIAALRKALGDGVDGARYIANVPGRGYSFVAPLSLHGSMASEPEGRAPDGVSNMPVSVTRLIGREAVMARLSVNLTQRRLVSIVGHGGIGKTSLVLALAARVREHYPSGVCFVDLAPLTEPGHVIEAIASSLGLPLPFEANLGELENWLRSRRLLLILDNCEHLLDAVAMLVERVLKRAPGLVVLTTSREPLDADGEWVHRLQPLDAPPDGSAIDSVGALGFAAVALLAERAAASLPTFTIDADNVQLAAALCRRLDGVPLAIEFAASRIGLLGLHGVYMQLDDRLRLLGSGRRTALPRHRTLRALLDWSFHLLSPTQQIVFRRCGVFKAGFSLDAANAVIVDATLPAAVVHDCLLDLVSKSLVRVELAHSPPNFSLLEITRAYALEQFDNDPDLQAVFRRHAALMVLMVRRGAAEWEEGLPQQWFLNYASHIGNFRTALDWCFAPEGDPALGIELLATDFHPMALFLGESEYRTRTRQALDAIEAGVPAQPIHQVRMYSIFAYISPSNGTTTEAAPCMLAVAAQEENVADQIEALYQLHAHSFGNGDYRMCARYSLRSEEIASRCGVPEMLHAKRLRALAAHYGGEHAVAAEYASSLLYKDDQLVPLRLTGWLSRRLSMQIVMARIFWMQGQGERAVVLGGECVRNAQGARFPAALSQAICLAAFPIAVWQGDYARAQALLQQLDGHLLRHPQHYWSVWATHLRQVLELRSAPASLLASLPGSPDAKLLDHLVSFGAWVHHEQGLDRWRRGMVGWTGPEVLRIQGEVLLRQDAGDMHGAAQAVFVQALELARRQQAHAWALRTSNSMARLMLTQGRRMEAQCLLQPWLTRLGAMGTGVDAAEARALLARC